jgi:hypothetical protein
MTQFFWDKDFDWLLIVSCVYNNSINYWVDPIDGVK